MKLKQNENGETMVVVENITASEVPFGSDEIKRQIAQHSQVIQDLQLQLQAVQEFESNTNIEQDMVISDVIDKPIIDTAMLESVVNIEPVIVEEIIKSEIEETEIKPIEEKLNMEERIA